MKKLVITSLISIMFIGSAVAAPEQQKPASFFNSKEQRELQNIQKFLFETPIQSPIPDVKYVSDTDNQSGVGLVDDEMKIKGMPMFKEMRIKITNYYKIKAHNEKLRQQELEKQELQDMENEDISLDEIQEKNTKNLIDAATKNEKKEKKSFNFLKKKNKTDSLENKTNNKDGEKNISNPTKPDGTIELQGGVKQVEAEKDAMLDCEIMNYLSDRGEIEALGHPVLVFPAQEVTLKADRMTYNAATNVIKAFGNVELIRGESTMYGEYLQLNMNEENGLMTNLKSQQMKLTIVAQNANATDDLVVLEKGKMYAEDSFILRLKTQMMSAPVDRMVIPEAAQSHLRDLTGDTKIKVVAKNIKVTAKEEHDLISAQKGTLYYGDKKLFNFHSFTAHTNKNHDYFEANYPEFGSRARIGMYAGPGFVFDTPFASTVKVVPFLNYKDKIGVGGAVKYKSATNMTDFMYGSAENIFVLKGRQHLDNKLFLQYGMNSYMDDWWMGQRMPKYMAELVYNDRKTLRDFLGEGRSLGFEHRLGTGYMQDSDVNRSDEKDMGSTNVGTARFKYMAQLNQTLYSYTNEEQKFRLNSGISFQGSAAVYGTGDTQFVGRVGPFINTQYKYWVQELSYYMSAYSDQTPMPSYDKYRYGHSNVMLREALRLNKYLTVAWAGSLNLSGDAPNGNMFQENAFVLSLGPDDLKVNVGYDFMRAQTYFSVIMGLDMKGSSIEYDRMEIKHPDKLGKDKKKYVKEITFEETQAYNKPSKKVYAEVIEIEDPNKEQI